MEEGSFLSFFSSFSEDLYELLCFSVYDVFEFISITVLLILKLPYLQSDRRIQVGSESL